MLTIAKEFHLSASHQLEGLPPDHPCARLHGHNYVVTIHITHDQLNDVGFVLDYGDLAPFRDEVDALDHHHLNDLMPFNPTAEHIAMWLHTRAVDTLPVPDGASVAVTVSETPKTTATYAP